MFFLSATNMSIISLKEKETIEKKVARKIDFLKLNDELNVVRKQPLGGVLNITVVHLHADISKNTPSFTNSFNYNFQSISMIYHIFSNVRPGNLF